MKKIENSPFDPFVKWFFPKLLPYVPEWVSANMISLVGMLGSMACFLFLYLSRYSHWFALAGALGVFVHWFADTLDGVVARHRGPTALGYYLDHFGDSVAVVFGTLGIFMIPGSHVVIGLLFVVLYLLTMIGGLIRIEFTRVMEFPAFGPTELHLIVIVVLVTHVFVDFGRPFPFLPALFGAEGSLAQSLGAEHGLSFIDLFGLVFIVAVAAQLIIEIRQSVNQLRGLDTED